MKIVEHRPECDGYAIIVDTDSGERLRLHATKRPKDVRRWAAEAVAQIEAARTIEVARPDPDAEAVEIVKRRLTERGQRALADQLEAALSARSR